MKQLLAILLFMCSANVIAQNNKLRTENRQLKQRIADLEKGIEKLKKEIEEKQEQ